MLKTGLLALHLVIMAAQYCQTLFMPAGLFLIDIKIDDPRTICIFLLKTDRRTAGYTNIDGAAGTSSHKLSTIK